MSTGRIITVFTLICLLVPAAVQAAPATDQVEGRISGVAAGAVTVTARSGAQVRVTLSGDTVIIQRRRVALEDIKPNDFVGVTARREMDGSLAALSINIFPPQFKDRIRQAQFVMDSGNVMTNATVFQNVRRIEGRTLYLKLGDGSAVIAVPKDAAVLRLTLIGINDLRAGMPLVARGTASGEGSLAATTITVDVR